MPDSIYKKKLRNRACAIITSGEWLLLLKQQSPTRNSPIWMPPGGGIQFGESISEAMIREVKEETGLYIEPGRMLWIHEYIEPPYHAIEYYCECSIAGGSLTLGDDPEHENSNGILLDLKFIPFEELQDLPVYPKVMKEYFVPGSKLPKQLTHVKTVKQGEV